MSAIVFKSLLLFAALVGVPPSLTGGPIEDAPHFDPEARN